LRCCPSACSKLEADIEVSRNIWQKHSRNCDKEIPMALMKTSNPALGEDTFRNLSGARYGGVIDETTACR